MSERIVYKFEVTEGQHIKLIANGPITKRSMAVLESFIKRQKQRLKEAGNTEAAGLLQRPT